eukprot:PhM_4_TR10381/c0_g1_i1/m.31138
MSYWVMDDDIAPLLLVPLLLLRSLAATLSGSLTSTAPPAPPTPSPVATAVGSSSSYNVQAPLDAIARCGAAARSKQLNNSNMIILRCVFPGRYKMWMSGLNPWGSLPNQNNPGHVRAMPTIAVFAIFMRIKSSFCSFGSLGMFSVKGAARTEKSELSRRNARPSVVSRQNTKALRMLGVMSASLSSSAACIKGLIPPESATDFGERTNSNRSASMHRRRQLFSLPSAMMTSRIIIGVGMKLLLLIFVFASCTMNLRACSRSFRLTLGSLSMHCAINQWPFICHNSESTTDSETNARATRSPTARRYDAPQTINRRIMLAIPLHNETYDTRPPPLVSRLVVVVVENNWRPSIVISLPISTTAKISSSVVLDVFFNTSPTLTNDSSTTEIFLTMAPTVPSWSSWRDFEISSLFAMLGCAVDRISMWALALR